MLWVQSCGATYSLTAGEDSSSLEQWMMESESLWTLLGAHMLVHKGGITVISITAQHQELTYNGLYHKRLRITVIKYQVTHRLFSLDGFSLWWLHLHHFWFLKKQQQQQKNAFAIIFSLWNCLWINCWFKRENSRCRICLLFRQVHLNTPKETCNVRETDRQIKTRELHPPILKYSPAGGSALLQLSPPVASQSSWQQQPGCGRAGAQCMLGDYIHSLLDSIQHAALDDRRRAQVSQTQRFRSKTRWEWIETLTLKGISLQLCGLSELEVPKLRSGSDGFTLMLLQGRETTRNDNDLCRKNKQVCWY